MIHGLIGHAIRKSVFESGKKDCVTGDGRRGRELVGGRRGPERSGPERSGSELLQ